MNLLIANYNISNSVTFQEFDLDYWRRLGAATLQRCSNQDIHGHSHQFEANPSVYKSVKQPRQNKYWSSQQRCAVVRRGGWPTLEWVATEGDGVHHGGGQSRLFRIIPACWLTLPPHSPDWLSCQPAFFCPIFVVLFCKLKHKTEIFRTRNNSVSQSRGAAEDWSLFRSLSGRAVRQLPGERGTAAPPRPRRAARTARGWPIGARPRTDPANKHAGGRVAAGRVSAANTSRGWAVVASPRKPMIPISWPGPDHGSLTINNIFCYSRVHFPHEQLLNLSFSPSMVQFYSYGEKPLSWS